MDDDADPSLGGGPSPGNGPSPALVALRRTLAERRPDLVVEPVRVAGVPTLRVHVGGGTALDVSCRATAWWVVPVQLGPTGAVPLRVPAEHDLGVPVDAPVELVLDALGGEVRATTAASPGAGGVGAAVPPAPGASARRQRTLTIAGLALAGLVVVGGTVLAAGNGYTPDPDTVRGTDLVTELAVGQCFDEDLDGVDDSQAFVDIHHCGTDHEYEVFGEFELDDGDFPGDEAAREAGDQGCYDLFEPYVGLDWEQSELDWSMYWPSEESWEDGDREVTCLLAEPEGHGTGSAEHSGR